MSDKLEKFVKEHKKQFDIDGPSADLWAKISIELDKKKVKKQPLSYKWMSIAAILVLSIGIYFGYQYRKINADLVMADINPQLGQKEMQFTRIIDEKRDSLMIFADTNPALYQQFTNDLAKLEKDYQELKKQLQNTPNKALVGKAMIKNLEMQAQVISQQLMIINRVTEFKKEINTI